MRDRLLEKENLEITRNYLLTKTLLPRFPKLLEMQMPEDKGAKLARGSIKISVGYISPSGFCIFE